MPIKLSQRERLTVVKALAIAQVVANEMSIPHDGVGVRFNEAQLRDEFATVLRYFQTTEVLVPARQDQ